MGLYLDYCTVAMANKVIHIKITKPLPEVIVKAIEDKKERRALYASGNIKAIRDKDNSKNVSLPRN